MTSVIGAEIGGVDFREPISEGVAKVLRQALLDHLAIFFRDQDISPGQLREVAQVFGPPAYFKNVTAKTFPDHPDVFIAEERKGPRGTLAQADEWHTDVTWEETPCLGIALHAQLVPVAGGDTCFASMYAAYDALSPAMQAFLDPLTAVHTNGLLKLRTARPDVEFGPTVQTTHPVIRVHPETGRKALYVNVANTSRIVELAQMESDAVLHFLFEHIKEPTFQCRYKWERHSLAIWDNRASQHYASADYAEPRRMHRVIIGSTDRPKGPAEARSTPAEPAVARTA
jgi:taurine dioxygenase